MALSRRSFARGTLAALGVAAVPPLAGGCGRAADAGELKFSDVQAQSHYTNVAAEWMAEELQGSTSDRLRMRVVASGSLGGPDETILAMQSGDVDLSWISTGQLAREVAPFNLLSCAYLIRDRKHFRAIATPRSPVYELFRKLIEQSIDGVRMVGIMGGPPRNLYTDGGGVRTPDDLGGRQVRVEDSPVKAETWRQFGADPVPLAWSEVYTALQSGVIAGAESSTDAYETSKLFEVAPDLSLTEHEYTVLPLLLSEASLRELSSADQEVVLELCAQASRRSWTEGWDRVDALEKSELSDTGVNVVRPDQDAFREVAAPMIDRVVEEYDADELRDAIEEATP